MQFDTGFYGFVHIGNIGTESLCIQDLGLEKRQNETYYYNNKSRDYPGYLFQYTLEGCGIYETSDNQYRLTKGKAFLLSFPDEGSYYLPPAKTREDNWTYFFIHFYGPAVEPFFRRIRDITGPVMSLDMESAAVRLFFDIFHSLQCKRKLEPYEDSEWLYRFLAALLRNIELPSGRSTNSHVSAAMDWLQTQYAKPLSLEEMSREIGVSLSHLSRQFHKEKGVTLIQYLTGIRLEHAMQLLINSELPISKVAKECGFSNGNYFTKVYKKVFHITPEDYRRQHQVFTGVKATARDKE